MNDLVQLFRDRQSWLMERILRYAQEHGYAKHMSTLVEAWRPSISGLTEAIASAVAESGFPDPGSGLHADRGGNPIAAFGRLEARRHWDRGIDAGMFLGFFVSYRQAYLDCIREFVEPGDGRDRMELALVRIFDCMNVAISTEWIALAQAQAGNGLATALREARDEKNRYLSFFESLEQPVIFLSPEGAVENLNPAAAGLLGWHGSHGHGYFAPRSDSNLRGVRGRNVAEVFPWLAGALSPGREDPDVAEDRLVVFNGPTGPGGPRDCPWSCMTRRIACAART